MGSEMCIRDRPSTAYDVYIQADCGSGDTSAFSGPIAFTTSSQCLSPSGLVLDSVNLSEAWLSWTSGGSEPSWNIEYGSTGFALGTGTSLTVNDNTNSSISEDFESFIDGYDYVSNNSSNWWNNGGAGGGGIIVSSPGAGYNSDGYIKSGDGWNRIEYNDNNHHYKDN